MPENPSPLSELDRNVRNLDLPVAVKQHLDEINGALLDDYRRLVVLERRAQRESRVLDVLIVAAVVQLAALSGLLAALVSRHAI